MSTLMNDETTDAAEGGKSRRIGRRVVLGLTTLLPGLLTLAALTSFVSGPDGGAHRFHDFTHFIWLGLLVVVPYALQWHRPGKKIALWQAAALGAPTLVGGGLLAGVSDPTFYVAFPLFAFLVWLTHPARSRLTSPGAGLSPVMAPLTALAAIPASLYAASQIDLQRKLAEDIHGAMIHYGSQALTVLFILVFAAVASLRSPGWQWAAGLAAAAGVALGAASLVFSGQSGTWSTPASLGVIALSLGYGAAARWEHRQG